MSEKTANAILRDIEIFCDEFKINQETFLNRIQYPTLISRLKDGKHVKPITIERVYAEMELQRLQMEIKDCKSIRQAVEIAHKFLRGQDVKLT